MLKVNNLTFGYKKKTILKSISFKVEAGEHFSIIGESGSGKSTLLKLIYGTYDLNSGHIFWKDNEILGPKHNYWSRIHEICSSRIRLNALYNGCRKYWSLSI